MTRRIEQAYARASRRTELGQNAIAAIIVGGIELKDHWDQ